MANNWKLEIGNWKFQSERGFTLVELLVVIAILGVLVSVVLVAFRNSQARARDGQRKSDLKQIANSLELFYADYGKYPDASAGSISACPYNFSTQTGSQCSWGAGEFRDSDAGGATKTAYFKVLPKDPIPAESYLYRVDGTGQKFQLFARLENSQDPQIITTSFSCGGTSPCNFAITSPNTTPTDF